jgi:TPR repeat protein
MLLLEEPDGRPHLVSGTVFATWLTDEPLRLVFLNACKSGTTATTGSAHPFAGVASALIRGGVPAVVAMQFPITDDAATEFARTFYERIAQNFPVDGAVAEGRKALYSDEERAEWATPVLYLRGKDGRLFTPAAHKHAAPAAAAAPPAPQPAPAPMAAFSAPAAPVIPWYKKPAALVGMGMAAMLALLIILAGNGEDPSQVQAEVAAADAAPAEAEAAAAPQEPGDANPALEAIEAIDPAWWTNEPEEAALAKAVFKTTSFDAVLTLADGGNGDRRASYIVAEAMKFGLNGAGKAPDIAMQWYNASAYKQLPVAELKQGYAYAEGVAQQTEGGEAILKDPAAAKVWFGRAAAQGNILAQNILENYAAFFPEQ